MSKQSKKPSRGQWVELVAEYEQSAGDETQEAFARRQGVQVASFRYWLYKLRGAVKEPGVRLVEVSGTRVASAQARVSQAPACVEVEVAQGRCTVRFGVGADAAFIGEVVATLAERLEC